MYVPRDFVLKVYFFLILIFTIGCQNQSRRDIEDAIDNAHYLLNSRNCRGALNALSGLYTNTNSDYLQVYATAYACLANFSTVRFFGDELAGISFTNSGFIGSLAAMSSSDAITAANDPDYVNLQTAIDALLYAGGLTDPTSANRENVFGQIQANNLNLQNLYMIMVQMGRWFYYYGGADSSGVKGAGGGNSCLLDYTDATAALAVNNPAGSTGSCTTTTDGHIDLIASRPRQCQGIVLFNNLLDITGSLTTLGGITTDLDNLTNFSATLNTMCTGAGLGNVCTVTSQNECETDPNITNATIQQFYIAILERLFT